MWWWIVVRVFALVVALKLHLWNDIYDAPDTSNNKRTQQTVRGDSGSGKKTSQSETQPPSAGRPNAEQGIRGDCRRQGSEGRIANGIVAFDMILHFGIDCILQLECHTFTLEIIRVYTVHVLQSNRRLLNSCTCDSNTSFSSFFSNQLELVLYFLPQWT